MVVEHWHVRLTLVLAFTCLILPRPAQASALERGTIELAPSAAFTHNRFSRNGEKLFTSTALIVSGNAGYCFTDVVEGEAGFLLTHLSLSRNGEDGSSSATGVGLNGGLKVNFPSSGNAIPFGSAGLGFVSYSGEGQLEIIAPILQAGMRLLVGPTGSINTFFQFAHRSNVGGEKALSDNQFALGVGISLFPARQ